MMSLLQEDVRSPQDARVLKVAVLGLPNSGKSSIINSLTNNAVCSVSRKVHTTRSLARAAITVGRTQLVFFDTPGTVTPDAARRHKLPSSLVRDAEEAVAQADALLLVVDGACRYTKLGLHPRLLRLLALHPTMPALLCITKVDRVKQRTSLLDVARQLTADTVSGRTSHAPQQPKPHDPYNVPNKTRQELVVFTSVKTGKGVDVLRELLTRRARPATWEYPPAMVTDQDPHQLALATVRAQFLDRLKFQLPYELRFSIDSWELSESALLIISCHCRRVTRLNPRHAALLTISCHCRRATHN
ncbi:hypothetical protein HAZT_HAZT006655 [Hyalella azteca]|uniref:GTPase Era, mitochondrial n=1 Tax=Hyalella azteca TaxID=294128 RepID=A0A6A0GT03_HYAAZ|nr:hypothetical protein HAZT_HAZT006655 [Hyalella azteca]